MIARATINTKYVFHKFNKISKCTPSKSEMKKLKNEMIRNVMKDEENNAMELILVPEMVKQIN